MRQEHLEGYDEYIIHARSAIETSFFAEGHYVLCSPDTMEAEDQPTLS